MFIELTEHLACPACGPPQGLVAVVEGAAERRVREGYLGCPACEARYPIRAGEVRFAEEGAVPPEPVAEEPAAIAALLGAGPDGGGILLLGPRLAERAADVARLAGAEVVALGGPPVPAGASVSLLRGVRPSALPLLDGRVRGVALAAPAPEDVEEAVRVLAPGGRLAAFRPGPELAALARELALEVLAAEERALVAVRR